MLRMGVHQNHYVVRESCILDSKARLWFGL